MHVVDTIYTTGCQKVLCKLVFVSYHLSLMDHWLWGMIHWLWGMCHWLWGMCHWLWGMYLFLDKDN